QEGSQKAKSMACLKCPPWGSDGGNRLRAATPRRARGGYPTTGGTSVRARSGRLFNPNNAAAAEASRADSGCASRPNDGAGERHAGANRLSWTEGKNMRNVTSWSVEEK